MLSLEQVKKINHEEPHSINLEKPLMNMLKPLVKEMVQKFFKKFGNSFDGDIDPNILMEIETIRKNVLNLLDKKCSEIVNDFDNNYERFCLKHGWYIHLGAKTRHQITKDELAYELCEIIRKLYFVYLESQFPKQYRMKTVEEFLLREN